MELENYSKGLETAPGYGMQWRIDREGGGIQASHCPGDLG